jgi:hypothetical protein
VPGYFGRHRGRSAPRPILEDVVPDGQGRRRAARVVEGGVDDHGRQTLGEAREVAERGQARLRDGEPAPDLIPPAAGAGDQEPEEREAGVERADAR